MKRCLLLLVVIGMGLAGCASKTERDEKAARQSNRVQTLTHLGANYLSRNQLVLDLANPEVQKFVYDMVDQMMTKHPQIHI